MRAICPECNAEAFPFLAVRDGKLCVEHSSDEQPFPLHQCEFPVGEYPALKNRGFELSEPDRKHFLGDYGRLPRE